MGAYEDFISVRCIEILGENSEARSLHREVLETIQKIKETFTPQDYALFCEYESQINNILSVGNREIYTQAKKDSL